MNARHYKASILLNKFLKLTLGRYLKHLFNCKIYNEKIIGLKPPYIILANHTNLWDPFLLSTCISEPVYFVTSDAYFRNPVLRLLLGLVGAIPKTKLVSDPTSIKSIISVSKNNGIIGIFPEGRRNWDGSTLPLLHPTAKLIKVLGLPVISILFRGAYLSMPRWSRKTRKGEILMDCNKILDSDEIERLTADEIFEKITISLHHDEYEYQKEHMIPYYSKSPAEMLELFLFCCPKCNSIGSMKSSGDIFFCTGCNYSIRYDKYGFFRPISADKIFSNPRDWNVWQLKYLDSFISKMPGENESRPIIKDNNILAYTGTKSKPLINFGKGSLLLYNDKIVFSSMTGDSSSTFNINGIYGENIQGNDKLEFYHNKVLYRFKGKPLSISAYKWVKFIETIKKIRKGSLTK